MGNRVGVIFHEDWGDFSPLLYSHYGADLIPFQIKEYIIKYYKQKVNEGYYVFKKYCIIM